MAAARIVILGCGYTGTRVARRLLASGHEVVVTARDTAHLQSLGATAIAVDVLRPESLQPLRDWIDEGTAVLYSLPSIGDTDLTPSIVPFLERASRVVYISTTGVYGEQRDVDVTTLAAPRSNRERVRVQAEETISQAFRSSLVLRPAAIYGPHRGIHAALRAGTYRLAAPGTNYVSRIHVDDLATHCIAGLSSSVTGAWPVADEQSCTSGEIAAFCAELLGIPLPPAVDKANLSETRRADRRVDGSAIRQALGIALQFPDFRIGIPACIAAERSEAAGSAPDAASARAL